MISSLMSPFISASSSPHTGCSCFVAMPGLSSPRAPKGQMMKLTTTAVLITTLLSVVLLASSCEARGLRVHGKKGSSSSKAHLPTGNKVNITHKEMARIALFSFCGKSRIALDHTAYIDFHNLALPSCIS
jgi:hypothetical protein